MSDVSSIVALPREALNQMMPMHVIVDLDGNISAVGPTLAKLRDGENLIGAPFLDHFALRRPSNISTAALLGGIVGVRLRVMLRDGPHAPMKGIAVALPDDGGYFLNLSFGISVVDAVGEYGLTSSDFAPTDLTVEMLYLVEAKSAVLNESKALNQRLQVARIAAEEQAFTDTLTGLKNRRAMDHVMARLIAAKTPFGLLHLDLDYFKDVNDSFGHAAGDHVLQYVAKVLVEATREGDTAVRAGGDEFVLIIHHETDEAKLREISERIIQGLQEPIPFEGQVCEISGSVGITTTAHYDDVDAKTMLADADAALYASKHAGRACVTIAAQS